MCAVHVTLLFGLDSAPVNIARRVVAEGLGTGALVAPVVGSGVMGDQLGNGNVAIALLANAVATGAALVALIATLSPVSGAHFNPVVTMAIAMNRELSWTDAAKYVTAQIVGAFAGVGCANLLFEKPIFFAS